MHTMYTTQINKSDLHTFQIHGRIKNVLKINFNWKCSATLVNNFIETLYVYLQFLLLIQL